MDPHFMNGPPPNQPSWWNRPPAPPNHHGQWQGPPHPPPPNNWNNTGWPRGPPPPHPPPDYHPSAHQRPPDSSNAYHQNWWGHNSGQAPHPNHQPPPGYWPPPGHPRDGQQPAENWDRNYEHSAAAYAGRDPGRSWGEWDYHRHEYRGERSRSPRDLDKYSHGRSRERSRERSRKHKDYSRSSREGERDMEKEQTSADKELRKSSDRHSRSEKHSSRDKKHRTDGSKHSEERSHKSRKEGHSEDREKVSKTSASKPPVVEKQKTEEELSSSGSDFSSDEEVDEPPKEKTSKLDVSKEKSVHKSSRKDEDKVKEDRHREDKSKERKADKKKDSSKEYSRSEHRYLEKPGSSSYKFKYLEYDHDLYRKDKSEYYRHSRKQTDADYYDMVKRGHYDERYARKHYYDKREHYKGNPYHGHGERDGYRLDKYYEHERYDSRDRDDERRGEKSIINMFNVDDPKSRKIKSTVSSSQSKLQENSEARTTRNKTRKSEIASSHKKSSSRSNDDRASSTSKTNKSKKEAETVKSEVTKKRASKAPSLENGSSSNSESDSGSGTSSGSGSSSESDSGSSSDNEEMTSSSQMGRVNITIQPQSPDEDCGSHENPYIGGAHNRNINISTEVKHLSQPDIRGSPIEVYSGGHYATERIPYSDAPVCEDESLKSSVNVHDQGSLNDGQATPTKDEPHQRMDFSEEDILEQSQPTHDASLERGPSAIKEVETCPETENKSKKVKITFKGNRGNKIPRVQPAALDSLQRDDFNLEPPSEAEVLSPAVGDNLSNDDTNPTQNDEDTADVASVKESLEGGEAGKKDAVVYPDSSTELNLDPAEGSTTNQADGPAQETVPEREPSPEIGVEEADIKDKVQPVAFHLVGSSEEDVAKKSSVPNDQLLCPMSPPPSESMLGEPTPIPQQEKGSTEPVRTDCIAKESSLSELAATENVIQNEPSMEKVNKVQELVKEAKEKDIISEPGITEVDVEPNAIVTEQVKTTITPNLPMKDTQTSELKPQPEGANVNVNGAVKKDRDRNIFQIISCTSISSTNKDNTSQQSQRTQHHSGSSDVLPRDKLPSVSKSEPEMGKVQVESASSSSQKNAPANVKGSKLSTENEQVVKTGSTESDQVVKPVSTESEQVVKPVSTESEQVVKPVITEKEQVKNPVITEKEQGVKPVITEKEQGVKPVSTEKEQVLKPVSTEKEQVLKPVSTSLPAGVKASAEKPPTQAVIIQPVVIQPVVATRVTPAPQHVLLKPKPRRHAKWAQWKASHSMTDLYKGSSEGLTVLPQGVKIEASLLPEAKLNIGKTATLQSINVTDRKTPEISPNKRLGPSKTEINTRQEQHKISPPPEKDSLEPKNIAHAASKMNKPVVSEKRYDMNPNLVQMSTQAVGTEEQIAHIPVKPKEKIQERLEQSCYERPSTLSSTKENSVANRPTDCKPISEKPLRISQKQTESAAQSIGITAQLPIIDTPSSNIGDIPSSSVITVDTIAKKVNNSDVKQTIKCQEEKVIPLEEKVIPPSLSNLVPIPASIDKAKVRDVLSQNVTPQTSLAPNRIETKGKDKHGGEINVLPSTSAKDGVIQTQQKPHIMSDIPLTPDPYREDKNAFNPVPATSTEVKPMESFSREEWDQLLCHTSTDHPKASSMQKSRPLDRRRTSSSYQTQSESTRNKFTSHKSSLASCDSDGNGDKFSPSKLIKSTANANTTRSSIVPIHSVSATNTSSKGSPLKHSSGRGGKTESSVKSQQNEGDAEGVSSSLPKSDASSDMNSPGVYQSKEESASKKGPAVSSSENRTPNRKITETYREYFGTETEESDTGEKQTEEDITKQQKTYQNKKKPSTMHPSSHKQEGFMSYTEGNLIVLGCKTTEPKSHQNKPIVEITSQEENDSSVSRPEDSYKSVDDTPKESSIEEEASSVVEVPSAEDQGHYQDGLSFQVAAVETVISQSEDNEDELDNNSPREIPTTDQIASVGSEEEMAENVASAGERSGSLQGSSYNPEVNDPQDGHLSDVRSEDENLSNKELAPPPAPLSNDNAISRHGEGSFTKAPEQQTSPENDAPRDESADTHPLQDQSSVRRRSVNQTEELYHSPANISVGEVERVQNKLPQIGGSPHSIHRTEDCLISPVKSGQEAPPGTEPVLLPQSEPKTSSPIPSSLPIPPKRRVVEDWSMPGPSHAQRTVHIVKRKRSRGSSSSESTSRDRMSLASHDVAKTSKSTGKKKTRKERHASKDELPQDETNEEEQSSKKIKKKHSKKKKSKTSHSHSKKSKPKDIRRKRGRSVESDSSRHNSESYFSKSRKRRRKSASSSSTEKTCEHNVDEFRRKEGHRSRCQSSDDDRDPWSRHASQSRSQSSEDRQRKYPTDHPKRCRCGEMKKPADEEIRDFFYRRALAGYCLVEFPTPEAAHHAMTYLSGTPVYDLNSPGKVTRTSYPCETKSSSEFILRVDNLSRDVDDLELFRVFSRKFPTCRSVRVEYDDERRSRGYGFVYFESEAEFVRALREMEGYTGMGRRNIHVSPVTPPRMAPTASTAINAIIDCDNPRPYGRGQPPTHSAVNQVGQGTFSAPHEEDDADLADPLEPLDIDKANREYMARTELIYDDLENSRWQTRSRLKRILF